MKSAALLKAVYKDCLDRGYILHDNKLYPPAQAAALGIGKPVKKVRSKNLVKTGWIDDERNIRNKAGQSDPFMMYVRKELNLDIWPEFFFSTERLFRFDYAVPVAKDGLILKVAIEQEGGIWAKGNSGHSSGKGISRDMEKSNLAQANGWVVIRRTPDQMITIETIELIKSVINNKIAML